MATYANKTVVSITTNPENLMAINALAGMGILTSDEALVDAALSEILALAPMKRRELDPMRDVDYLLVQHQLEKVSISLHHYAFVNSGHNRATFPRPSPLLEKL